MAAKTQVRIVHHPTGTLIASGPLGWGITPFEGNYYIARQHLRDGTFTQNFFPGICPYKGMYLWLDLRLPGGSVSQSLGWKYVLPNPLLPFTWYRVAVPGAHPELTIEVTDARSPISGSV